MNSNSIIVLSQMSHESGTSQGQPFDQRTGSGHLEPYFENSHESHFWISARFELIATALQSFDFLTRETKLLEVGCGNGHLQRLILSAFGNSIDVCDLNFAGLRRAAENGIGRVFYYDILECQNQFEATYEIILLLDVLEHIKDPIPFLRAIRFMLAPGGSLIINVPARKELFSAYDQANGHFRRYSTASLRQELQAAGFEIQRLHYWGFLFYPLLWLRKILLSLRRTDSKALDLGFKPPIPLFTAIFKAMASLERKLLVRPPLGTSVFAVATETRQ